MLGKFGEQAIEGLVKYVAGPFSYASEMTGEGLLGFDSPRIVMPLAQFVTRDHRQKADLARRWIDKHRETALYVIGPQVAAEGDEKLGRILRELAKHTDVDRVLAPWGP